MPVAYSDYMTCKGVSFALPGSEVYTFLQA